MICWRKLKAILRHNRFAAKLRADIFLINLKDETMNDEKKNLESDEVIAKSDLSSELGEQLPDAEIILKDTPELKIIDKPGWWVEINGIRYTYALLQAWGEGGIAVGGKFEITKREEHYFELHRLDC